MLLRASVSPCTSALSIAEEPASSAEDISGDIWVVPPSSPDPTVHHPRVRATHVSSPHGGAINRSLRPGAG